MTFKNFIFFLVLEIKFDQVIFFISEFFPKLFAFSYSHTIFLFNLTLADARTSDYSALVLMLTVIFVIPFIVMVRKHAMVKFASSQHV